MRAASRPKRKARWSRRIASLLFLATLLGRSTIPVHAQIKDNRTGDRRRDAESVKPALPELQREPPQRFFIQRIDVGSGILTSPADLLVRVQEELPFEILRWQNLIYYDPTAVESAKDWNPEAMYRSRAPDKIARSLAQLNMKWMIKLSLSLAPGGRDEKRMLLSGRLVNLPRLTCVVTRLNGVAQEARESSDRAPASADQATAPPQETDAEENDGTHCEADEDLQKRAVRDGSVDLNSFDDLRPSIRSLFARLFELPEIAVRPGNSVEFHTDELPIVDYDIVSNRRMRNDPDWLSRQNYQLVSRLYLLTGDNFEEVCSNARRSLQRIFNGDRSAWLGSTRATPIPVGEPRFRTIKNGEGLGQITIDRPFASTYLLATSLLRIQQQNDYQALTIPAEPAITCIRVREPAARLGFGIKWNVGLPNVGGAGLDFFAASQTEWNRGHFLPALSLGPVLGLEYERLGRQSEEAPDWHQATLSLRTRLIGDIVRFPISWKYLPHTLFFVLDGGFGVAWLALDGAADPYRGWYATATIGGGMGVRHRAGLVFMFVAEAQWRISALGPVTSFEVAPPPNRFWLVWGADWAVRRKKGS